MKRLIMRYKLIGLITITLCFLFSGANAVTVYECVDEAGNSTFQDRCPPGTTPANEKKISTGNKEKSTDDEEKPDVATTLYVMSNCEACDVVNGLLTKYGVNFNEVNVEADIELQIQLKEKISAEASLTLPTTIIGETVIIGYQRQDLITALEATGHSLPNADEETGK